MMEDGSTAAVLLALLVFLVVVLAVLALIGYIFSAIGLYAMAKKRSVANKAFWAWIPVGQYYLMGLLAKDTGECNGTRKYASMPMLLPFGYIAVFIIDLLLNTVKVPILGSLLGIAMGIVFLVCLYGVIEGYDIYDKAGMHIALSFFIPLYSSFLLFAFRNRPFQYGAPSGNNQITPSL